MYCWLTNDRETYNYYMDYAREEDISTYTLHEILKTDAETMVDETIVSSGWMMDLMAFAVDSVNW